MNGGHCLMQDAVNIVAYEDVEITTRSHPDAFPSALRQKRKTQTKLHAQGDQGTVVRVWNPLMSTCEFDVITDKAYYAGFREMSCVWSSRSLLKRVAGALGTVYP
jgi:hypothetical protein